jgi:6-phosphogluconolactonase
MERKIKKFKTPEDLAENLAVKLRDDSGKKIKLGDHFYIALSGGNTPKLLFKVLAVPPFNTELKWEGIHLFWGDERCVPPESDESNYGTAKKILIDHISIPEKNIHRIKGEAVPEKETLRYAGEIKKIVPSEKDLPRFDCVLLGLGEDGHTASLFPGKELYAAASEICGVAEKPNPAGSTMQKRISLTKNVICNAEQILFLVTGTEKSETLSEIINETITSERFPAANIQNIYGFSEWWIDEQAASRL